MSASPWSTALPDWKERIVAGQSLVPALPLFSEQAAKGLRIFKRLRIPDVHGQPTMAEACGPWYFPIVEALFGSYDTEARRRMIQEYFLLIPKKNGKSSSGGALMLTALIMNERPEAEFNLIAPTMQIAGIAFKQAVGTIKADPSLSKLFRTVDHRRTIINLQTDATLAIKAADTDVVTGGKALGTMVDETHEFARKAKAADIFLELRGALAARPDGFFFQTTTQSKDVPAGVFKAELEQARAVRDGEIEAPILPVLYEFPDEYLGEDDRWRDPSSWGIVNPNLDRSVDVGFLERQLDRANRQGIEELRLVASQHFNVEIGLRLANDRWRGADHWEAAAEPVLIRGRAGLANLLARSEVAVVGIDGGGLDDMLGLAVIGRCATTRRWLLWGHAWIQPGVLELRKDISARLRDFEAQGDLTVCAEVTQDVIEVADIVARIDELGLLPAQAGIGVDRAGIASIGDELEARGLGAERIAPVSQGYMLNPHILGMERKLADGTLRHRGQPMMAWCVGNAKAVLKGSAVTIEKQTAGRAKIDPLIAAFNAFAMMSRAPLASGRSFWEAS